MMVAARTRDGQVKEPRRQEQRGKGDADRGQRARGRGLRARVEIHHRAGKAAGHRVAGRESRGEVRRAEADQLLVGADRLAALGGQCLRDRHRLDEADQRRSGSAGRQRRATAPGRNRQRQRRQALRHIADDRDARRHPGPASAPPGSTAATATTGPALRASSAAARAGRLSAISARLQPLARPRTGSTSPRRRSPGSAGWSAPSWPAERPEASRAGCGRRPRCRACA